jgi:hypothetical protein
MLHHPPILRQSPKINYGSNSEVNRTLQRVRKFTESSCNPQTCIVYTV